MKTVTLGTTGITVPQNGFGALPIQRADKTTAVKILRRALDGGIVYYDSARGYSDSEEKLGLAFEGKRDQIILATKTPAKTPEQFRKDLDASLTMLKTDYIDILQFHNAQQVYKPGDGTGMYECMLEAKQQGKILHIGVTAHKLQVAMDCVSSGLYETMQFPFSYLSGEKEQALVQACRDANMGFIAMKGLAGGLINRAEAAMAFMTTQENVLPIWGIQKESELEEWLSFMENTPVVTPEIAAYIENEKKEIAGDFCRGCGYCMPCPMGIQINNCARMSLLLRRAPSAGWLSPANQEQMNKIDTCINCRSCASKCPYELDTPNLLRKNLEDYRKVLAGEISVSYEDKSIWK